MPTISLSTGMIEYTDTGSGPTLVFIHGLLVNHLFWRKVIPTLTPHFRCIAPTLPLGAHQHPMSPDTSLTPPDVARIISEFIAALHLKEVTLVGCDTGGALCQLVVTKHPQHISALVLTNCDAYENFFPPLLRLLQWSLRLPGFTPLLAQALRFTFVQWLLIILVAKNFPDASVRKSYFEPLRKIPGIMNDLRRFTLSVYNRYTLEAARHFKTLHIPVLIVWGKDDFLFPPKYAERLNRAFPNARLEWVPNSRTFVSEDQPDALARHLIAFASQPVSTSRSAASAQTGAQP